MKAKKRILSVILALCLIASFTATPFCAFSYEDDYDSMIAYFQEHMKNREEDISFTFTTTDSKYTDYYYDTDVSDLGNALYNKIFFDIFLTQNATCVDPYIGDYLYNSVSSAAVVDKRPRTVNNQYVFDVEFRFGYYSSANEESYVKSFVESFSRTYIGSNMSDYQKVKTIYDFVVRNATYDFDVFHNLNNEYPIGSTRYLNSHSAYGAIYGNLIKDGKTEQELDLSYDTILSGEKIVKTADQGLAVCEGYSKLFYALCIYNGIPCRIVDGDNTANSGKSSDPHEWNYVYLNDGVKPDGARWYQIDSTFASQASIKEIDMNSYDYFLKGSSNSFFTEDNHQMPYADFGTGGEITVKEQLYDWYAAENISSVEDYQIPYTAFNTSIEAAKGYIIRRITDYGVGKGEQIAYIYTDLNKSFLIAVDENRNVIFEEVEGFDYTGLYSRFDVLLPYFIPEYEYHVESLDGSRIVSGIEVDTYGLTIVGENNTKVSVPFKIVPMNMSNTSDNYNQREIQQTSPYTGQTIVPEIYIVDGYDNPLVKGRDFSIEFYSDAARTQKAVLKDMGTYWCDIQFFGNYCGDYIFSFNIGKMDLSVLAHPEKQYEYKPKAELDKNNIKSAADLYKKYTTGLNVGGIALKLGEDFTVSSTGGLTWGSTGTITLTGVSSSSKVIGGTKTTFTYKINKKHDISSLNGYAIDTSAYYYTGSAVVPTGTNGLDGILEKGVDYKIVSYSNNINAGEASAVIEGIGGCTGTAVMKYYINPLSLGAAGKISIDNLKLTNGVFSYNAKYDGKVLVKGTDFTEKVTETSTGYKLTLTGKGNYTSSVSLNVNVNKNQQSSSGETTIPTSNVPTVNKSAISKLTAKKKTIVVKWKAVGGSATGYRIEYSLKKNFKKSKTINVTGGAKTSYTIKKLKSKKVYYVRIRTFYKKGRTVYLSEWSKAKKVRVK